MKITLSYFGRLTELTGKTSEVISVDDMRVRAIKVQLEQIYPTLKTMSYQLAENNNILNQEASIQTQRLDVFPPFSGG